MKILLALFISLSSASLAFAGGPGKGYNCTTDIQGLCDGADDHADLSAPEPDPEPSQSPEDSPETGGEISVGDDSVGTDEGGTAVN
jgi:hypothetical protein